MRWPISPLRARRVAVEDVVEQAGARGRREILGAEADQAARRNPILEPHAPAAVGHHRDELALALGEARHHAALILLGEVDRELLPRLVHHAVDDALDHGRPRYRELIAFAAHVLDQHRQVQLAAAGHAELVRVVRLFDAQRDVVQQLLLETCANLAAREVLAFRARERRLVDLERHRDRGLVDLQRLQALALAARANGIGDLQIFDAAEDDDVAGARFGDRRAREALEAVELHELRVALRAVALHERHRHVALHDAAADAADTHEADVRVVVETRYLQLKRAFELDGRRRDVVDNGLEQRLHVAAARCRIGRRIAFQRGGVDHRESRAACRSHRAGRTDRTFDRAPSPRGNLHDRLC